MITDPTIAIPRGCVNILEAVQYYTTWLIYWELRRTTRYSDPNCHQS
jgi:hypothetical protein